MQLPAQTVSSTAFFRADSCGQFTRMSVVMTSARLGRHCRVVASLCSSVIVFRHRPRFVHRVHLGLPERPAPACARAGHADQDRTADRQPQGRPDTPLRAGVPDRCVSTSGSLLSGVHTRFQVIDTSEQEHVAGVAFKPGGMVPFFRVPAHEASDADVPPELLWGFRHAVTLRERLLESRTIEAALDVRSGAAGDGARRSRTLPLPMPSPRSIERHRRPALHE